MHVLFQIRPRLILISFLENKSPVLGVSVDKFPGPRRVNSFKGEAFSSLCSLHGMIWNQFLPYPNYMSSLSNEQTITGYFPQFEKWPRVGFLAVLFLHPNHGRCLHLSADAYIVNREWDSLMTISPNANRESWRETAFLLPLFFFLGDYYSRLTIQCVASFVHTPANVLGCYIVFSQLSLLSYKLDSKISP